MKKFYVAMLGILSGLVSTFLFTFLDFYAFLQGPSWWFNPINEYVLPVIVGLLVVNIVANKFTTTIRLYLNLISGIISYVGSYIIMSTIIFLHQLLI